MMSRSKNPDNVRLRDMEMPMVLGYELDRATLTPLRRSARSVPVVTSAIVPVPARKLSRSPDEFVWAFAGKVADCAVERFKRAPGTFSRVEVFCTAAGAVYVTDASERWSRVRVDGLEDCPEPVVHGDFVASLLGAHTHGQWMQQMHAAMRRLPLLVVDNGWED